MPVRVSATDRVRTKIDELFAQGRELPEILEEVAQLGAQLLMQAALEAEVTEFLGRERYQTYRHLPRRERRFTQRRRRRLDPPRELRPASATSDDIDEASRRRHRVASRLAVSAGDRLLRAPVVFVFALVEALDRQAVDRVLLSDADGDDAARGGIDVGVDHPEPAGWTARDIELRAGQAGEVATEVSLTECLAGDPSVRQVIEGGSGRIDDVGTVSRKSEQVGADVRVRDESVSGRMVRRHAGLCPAAPSAAWRNAACSLSSFSHGRRSANLR